MKVTTQNVLSEIQKKFPEKSQKEIKDFYEEVLNVFRNCLENKDDLYLKNVGSLKNFKTKERKGRNLHTGESLVIPEKSRIKFTPSKNLKELINKDIAEKSKTNSKKKASKKNPYKKGK